MLGIKYFKAKEEADTYKRFKSEFERYLSEEEKNEISDKIYERQEAEIEGGLWQDFDLDQLDKLGESLIA